MCAGRIIIPTYEEGWEIVKRRGASPNDFIHEKIAEFVRSESGLPGR
jgi:hypothetical protein